jgi:ribosomal protein L22
MAEEKENKNIEEKKQVETSKEIATKPEVKSPEKEVSKEAPKEEAKKKKAPKKKKKELAIARGESLRISTKHAVAICKVIKGKTPDAAVKRLEEVVSMKRVIPMAGREVAHQKGKGIAGAKFPKKASLEIIRIIKQAKANAIAEGIENTVITKAMSNKAQTPMRRGGVQAKRTHITIEVKDKIKLIENKK